MFTSTLFLKKSKKINKAIADDFGIILTASDDQMIAITSARKK